MFLLRSLGQHGNAVLRVKKLSKGTCNEQFSKMEQAIEILTMISNLPYSEQSLLTKTMTGRGKGGKGLGKGGAKRHRKVLRDNIQVS